MQGLVRFMRSLFLFELIKGLSLTGKYLLKRKFTLHYPEEKAPI